MSSALSFHKFSASNGLLRVIILILEVIILGLGTGSFRSNAPEAYFVTVVSLSFAVAIMGIVLAWLNKPFAHSKAAKNMDYLCHLYIAWLLFNASLAKLVCANHPNKSDSIAAVRILSGVFGLMNSGLFCWLAYLTAAEKQGFPCRFSTEVNAFEEEEEANMKTISRANLKPLFKTTEKFGSWSWERSCSRKSVLERLEWSILFDGGIMQARLYSLVLIILNVIFLGCSYNEMSRSEEYFLSVVCINMAGTVLLHMVYLLGLSSFVDNDLRIFDKSFHICASIFLFIGANLMLASTIRPVNFIGAELIPEKTLSATLGIVGSFLYGYIGLKQTSMESINTNIDQTELLTQHLGVPENGMSEHEKLKAKQARVLRQIRPALIFEGAGKI
ncbi:unnamed protein product [Allacma fusca]|uniref:MARVEL domain-containing protein n=1 Tax=Allacma fusca TaxID=39272 RepID=A0A8J2KYD2_9HEXA|nr:unnamed protein product [Allacma fusca]